MKAMLRYLVLGLVSMFLFVGCSKQPTDEINSSKSAVDTVVVEGAKYAPEDTKKLNDDLSAAMNEIKTQDSKLFKNYSKAKEMLAKAKSDAEALKAGLTEKKEQAKQNALALQNTAKTSLDEAKTLLSKAPRGKGTKADIEAMKADIKGLEESLMDVQKLIDTEDYALASDKANAIKDKAVSVSDQIKQALEKVGAKKK